MGERTATLPPTKHRTKESLATLMGAELALDC